MTDESAHIRFAQALEARWPGLWTSLWVDRFKLGIGHQDFARLSVKWRDGRRRTLFLAYVLEMRKQDGHFLVDNTSLNRGGPGSIGTHLEMLAQRREQHLAVLRRLPRAEREILGIPK